MIAKMAEGVPQADGRLAVEPRMDIDVRREGTVIYMP